MTNHRKKSLDYIPLAILITIAIISLWKVEDVNINLDLKHLLGLAFLGITILLFFVRHIYGVFALGIILFLGLIGIYSFDLDMRTTTYYAGQNGQGYFITLFVWQPIFLIWIALHFLFSWKNYLSIFGRKKTQY